MCLMLTNLTAEAALERIGGKEKERCEQRLARYAAAADVDRKEGMELLINTVADWAKIDELRGVRKLRIGRHRFYITGKHTDCRYSLCFVLVSKRAKDDQPWTKRFQEMIKTAVADNDVARVLETPVEPDDEEAPEEDIA